MIKFYCESTALKDLDKDGDKLLSDLKMTKNSEYGKKTLLELYNKDQGELIKRLRKNEITQNDLLDDSLAIFKESKNKQVKCL